MRKLKGFETSEVEVMNESHNELLQSPFVFLLNVEWTMVDWSKLRAEALSKKFEATTTTEIKEINDSIVNESLISVGIGMTVDESSQSCHGNKFVVQ